MTKEKYNYDYANKCDCGEDDNCGCSYPNNLPHNFSCTLETDLQKPQSKTSDKEKNND